MLPDTASHQLPQLVHHVVVGTRVVQHHNSPMLNIVKPPLGRDKLVFSKLRPNRAVVPVGGDRVVVSDLLSHAEVLWLVFRWDVVALHDMRLIIREDGVGGMIAGVVHGVPRPIKVDISLPIIALHMFLTHLDLMSHITFKI